MSALKGMSTEQILDTVAAALLVGGLVLPWNLDFGVGIRGTSAWMLAALTLLTALVLASIALRNGKFKGFLPSGGGRGHRLQVMLCIPYLLALTAFVGYAVLQSIRYGGTGETPPGVGPGSWLGLAGVLLAVRPSPRAEVLRLIGLLSVGLAVVSVLFNLYWRLRFVIPHVADPETSRQNLVTSVAALCYGLVALAPVVVVARWLTKAAQTARIALVFLGVSTVLSGAIVWLVPVGRDVDAFHGIAQSTSTVGVGYEGYLAWIAAAALIAGSSTAGGFSADVGAKWRPTAARCLTLIAIWCAGNAVLRVVDIASAAVLDLPTPAYNWVVMMAFDLIVALLAAWALINALGDTFQGRTTQLVFGALFVLVVARLVIGVSLMPRVTPLNPGDINDVWGNDLYQQVTSTFDVVLCVLALLLAALVTKARRAEPPTGIRQGSAHAESN